MDRKIVMLLIGIVAIGMFALPSTLAMYTGQHTFVDGANVNCEKCHGTAVNDVIQAELVSVGNPHYNFTCKKCHGFGDASLNPNDPDSGHAATIAVDCIGCHFNASTYISNNATSKADVANDLASGAHDVFYANASLIDPNLACLGCHTGAPVSSKINGTGSTSGSIDLNNYNY